MKHLPSAPSIAVFDEMIEDEIAELREVQNQYRWLYPSGYAKGKRETNERVRRDVSGANGDLTSDSAIGQREIRRQVEEAGDHVRQSLAHSKGASTALGRAQDRIEGEQRPTLVALDPLGSVGTSDGMTPTEAKDWQKRRNARVGRDGAARRRRQDQLISAVIRSARKLIEDGGEAPKLAAAIDDLDRESATFVSAPWGREEGTG